MTNLNRDLEKQLHEQYAINGNANVGHFITMISALVFAFAGYGYVLNQHFINDSFYSLPMTYIGTMAVLTVVAILYLVAVELGSKQRSDQFVVHRIREKAYKDDKDSFAEIYANYKPTGKNYFTFVQGMYNVIAWALLAIYVGIVAITAVYTKCESGIVWLVMYMLLLMVMILFLSHKYCKYKLLSK